MNRSVKSLLQRYVAGLDSIVSDRVRRAFLTVERHRFLEGFYRCCDGEFIWQPLDPQDPAPDLLEYIYTDNSLVTSLTPLSSSTQPWLMARMLELLELEKGMRVLEIGTGTGYNAALLAEIVGKGGQVTTIEIHSEIAARARRLLDAAGYTYVHLQVADGYFGWAGDAPYDRIIVTAACADIAPSWLEQLRPDGQMVIPLCHGGRYTTPLVVVKGDGQAKVVEYAWFGEAQGKLGALGLWPDLGEKRMAALLNQPEAVEKVHLAFGKQGWREICYDFHYFLALNDPRTYDGPSQVAGIGLWEAPASAVALLPSGAVKLLGSEALYEQLIRLHDEYMAFNHPRLQDYKISFTLKSLETPPRLERTGLSEWVIERRYTCQYVSLERGME